MAAPDSSPQLDGLHRYDRHTLSGFVAAELLHRFRRTFHRKVKVASKQESVVLLDDHNSSAGSSAEIPLAVPLRRVVQSLIARIEPDGYKPLATQELRSLSTRDRFSTGPDALIPCGHHQTPQPTSTKQFTRSCKARPEPQRELTRGHFGLAEAGVARRSATEDLRRGC